MRIPADKHKSMKFDWGRAFLFVLLVTALSSICGAWAAELPVLLGDDITAAAAVAKPGDTIVMQDGSWPDADILFLANGTSTKPITLRAQTLGRVFLTGSSRLRLAGDFLVVDGLV